jgi:hypothetical protein
MLAPRGGVLSVAAVKAGASLLAASTVCFLSQRAHAIRVDFAKLVILTGIAGLALTVLTSEAASRISLSLRVPLFLLSIALTAALLISHALRSFTDRDVRLAAIEEMAGLGR